MSGHKPWSEIKHKKDAKRVLVTGSHGFIGSQLVLALRERGDEVIEWDTKVKFQGDVLHSIPPPKIDEIYHLACVNQEEALSKEHSNLLVNAYGTKKMAEWARMLGARFVYTSTASVYGQPWEIPTKTSRILSPKSDYAIAKLAGEHFVKNSGADYTIFRLSNVYGPGQSTENPYCGVVAKFFEAAMAGEPLKVIGDGSQTRDFTYVGDILPHLMNPELKGVLNCSHGVETSINQLHRALNLMWPTSDPFLTYQRIPERPVDGIQRRCLVSDVNCPTDLKTGLKRTYDWVLSETSALSNDSGRKASV